MREFTSDEVREGLEGTLTYLQQDWSNPVQRHGQGGCMIVQMRRAAAAMGLEESTEAALFKNQLVKACGFNYNSYALGDGKTPVQVAQYGKMYTWNDDPNRTHEEVIDRVKTAIKGIIDAG